MLFASKVTILIFALVTLTGNSYSQSQSEQLSQLVTQLQTTPTDNALRERIIKLAEETKPAPAIPEEARRAFVRGNAAMTAAKSVADAARPVQLYEEALTIAPWWGDAYFNLSKARELRQEYDLAISALRFFLLSAPSEADARQAQDQIYVLEEKRDRQAKEAKDREAAKQLEEAAERRKAQAAEALNKLRGQWVGKYCDGTKRSGPYGCTESERGASNWYYFKGNGVDNTPFTFMFPSEGVIKIPAGMRTWVGCALESDIWGVPDGPNPADIRWEERVEGRAPRRIWSEASSDGSWITMSCTRPLSGADPNSRDLYFSWTRQ